MLARAFEDDPVMLWSLPAEEVGRRLSLLFATVARHFHLPNGATELAVDGGHVLGAAMWDPPGRWRSAWWRVAMALPALLRACGRRAQVAAMAMDAMERAHPAQPHWYLAVIGTDPPAQGRGVGGALLRSRLARCDDAGLPAYLESSKESNVPFYQRFGFEVTREITLPGGGPTTWAMWRRPG